MYSLSYTSYMIQLKLDLAVENSGHGTSLGRRGLYYLCSISLQTLNLKKWHELHESWLMNHDT